MTSHIQLVIGLGNADKKYKETRHNVGHKIIDTLDDPKIGLPATLELFKTPGFMNSCGIPIAKKIRDGHYPLEDVLIVCDDFSIPLGTLRIRLSGSSGGHNGLNSIIEELGTKDIPRLRIGIGPVPPDEDPADFVLHPFKKSELTELTTIKTRAADAIAIAVKAGLDEAMNKHNGVVA